MRKSLGKILQWVLLGVLFLGIPSALADPINTIAGWAGLDQSSPRVWRHGTSELLNDTTTVTAAGQYAPFTKAVLYGCDGTCANLSAILQRDPNSDGVITSDNHISTASVLYGFNDTTFDRLRARNADALTTGVLDTATRVFSGTSYDRARSASGDSLGTTGILAAGNVVFNGTNFNRVRGPNTNTNAIASFADGRGLQVTSLAGLASSPATEVSGWNQLVTASANNLSFGVVGGSVLATAPMSSWSVTNTPAAATQATASRAAGAAGVRHVATTITACFSDTAAEPTATVNLRDGATGAGTVIRTWFLGISAANDSKCVNLSGLAMLGTAATAMTLEFAAAGSAGSIQTVTLTGFSTQ